MTTMTTTAAYVNSTTWNTTWDRNVTSSNHTDVITTTINDDVTVTIATTQQSWTEYDNSTVQYDVTTLNDASGSGEVDDANFNTVTLAGSIAAIVCYFCIVCLLFGMGMQGIRSHIHCNVCFSLLSTHVLLLVGAQREAETLGCKIVSILTQYFILAGLTWLMLEGVHLFRLSMVGSDIGPKVKGHEETSLKIKKEGNGRRSAVRNNPSEIANGRANGDLQNGHISRHNDRAKSRPHNASLPHNASTRAQGISNHNNRQHRHCDEIQKHYYEQLRKDKGKTKGCCSRLASFYFIGWIGPALFIGATVPAALTGYGRSENCWLATGNDVVWVFCAPVPAIFLFHCLAMIFSVTNYNSKIKQVTLQRERKTEITTTQKIRRQEIEENVETEPLSKLYENSPSPNTSVPTSSRARDVDVTSRSPTYSNATTKQAAGSKNSSSPDTSEPTSSRARDVDVTGRLRTYSNATTKQAGGSKNSREIIPTPSDSDASEHAFQYFEFQDHYDEIFEDDDVNDVTVHPPLYDVHRHTLAVSLPDKELNEPVAHFISAVYWHSILLPLVSATWSAGIVALNFHWIAFNYAFCVLNITQAIFIFAFYCVVTFRLRHKWYVMTAKEVDEDARPITILVGDDAADGCDAINAKRMGFRRQKRRKIPNIDLMTRTPTPFSSNRAQRLRNEDSNEYDTQRYRDRWNHQWPDSRLNKIDENVYSSLESSATVMTPQPTIGRHNEQLTIEDAKKGIFPDCFSGDPSEGISPKPGLCSSAPSAGNEITFVHALQQSCPVNVLALPQNTDEIYNSPVRTSRETDVNINNDNCSVKSEDINDILQSVTPSTDTGRRSQENRTSAARAKPPFVKSMSERDILPPKKVRATNSLPLSPVNLDEILSNDPFGSPVPAFATPSETGSRVSTASGGSSKALLGTRVTPPMMIDSPNTSPAGSPVPNLRKTYTIEPKSRKPDEFKAILPKPRRQVQKFSPISIFNTKKELNSAGNSNEKQNIPEIRTRNSLIPGDAIKILFKKGLY